MPWHVFYSRPKAEQVAARNLQALGIEACSPTKKILGTGGKYGKKWIHVPFFPNYVFADAGPERLREIEKVSQIIRFVQIGKEYARLTPDDVDRIKRMNDCPESVQLEQAQLIAGQQVEIQNGAFIGLQGIVIDPSRNNKVYLAIEGLRCYVSVESADLRYRVLHQEGENVGKTTSIDPPRLLRARL